MKRRKIRLLIALIIFNLFASFNLFYEENQWLFYASLFSLVIFSLYLYTLGERPTRQLIRMAEHKNRYCQEFQNSCLSVLAVFICALLALVVIFYFRQPLGVDLAKHIGAAVCLTALAIIVFLYTYQKTYRLLIDCLVKIKDAVSGIYSVGRENLPEDDAEDDKFGGYQKSEAGENNEKKFGFLSEDRETDEAKTFLGEIFSSEGSPEPEAELAQSRSRGPLPITNDCGIDYQKIDFWVEFKEIIVWSWKTSFKIIIFITALFGIFAGLWDGEKIIFVVSLFSAGLILAFGFGKFRPKEEIEVSENNALAENPDVKEGLKAEKLMFDEQTNETSKIDWLGWLYFIGGLAIMGFGLTTKLLSVFLIGMICLLIWVIMQRHIESSDEQLK